ncbi:hypothetical protein RUMGNA_01917 [Mediterraneibacter gnavus ATCC 29149]|uniref:Core-binding (CB) domain-containing protein n=1 Tax=Mediterraneibacter gnavus (strain ATCC 29149 / DSM 114966 / JCM 6515 / VPI C7-9) TaxID=411470 RepID=A7B2Y9_MEDG7|nr:hypothetical protein RUMGNA_01917 [Mediterraneibacter gnavus ATCC 29149]
MESNQTTERKTYHEQKYIDNTLRLREILKTLPAFAKDYFRAAEPTTSAKTRISYAYDIRVFFHFLMENNPVYKDYTIDQFTPQDLEQLSPVDIEEYQEYLKVYQNPEEKQITNTEKDLPERCLPYAAFTATISSIRSSRKIQHCLSICQSCTKKQSSVWIRTRWLLFWTL